MITVVLGAWSFATRRKDERGASLVEYLLLVALIAMVAVVAVLFLGGEVDSRYDDAGSQLTNS